MTSARKRKPLYPVRDYLGRYEAYTLKLYSRGRWYMCDQYMEDFLSYFPEYQGWEEFSIADAEDYRILKARKGHSQGNIEDRLLEVKSFYRWLNEVAEVHLHDIVVAHSKPRREQTKNRLSLDDFRRLMNVSSFRLRTYLLDYVCMADPNDGRALNWDFKRATQRAGMTWMGSLGSFKLAVRGLWKEIIRRSAPDLRREFLDDEWANVT